MLTLNVDNSTICLYGFQIMLNLMCQRFQIVVTRSSVLQPKDCEMTGKGLHDFITKIIRGQQESQRMRYPQGWDYQPTSCWTQVILSLYLLLILCECVLWLSQSVEFVHSVQLLLWIGFFLVVNKCQSTYPDIILSFVFVKKKSSRPQNRVSQL